MKAIKAVYDGKSVVPLGKVDALENTEVIVVFPDSEGERRTENHCSSADEILNCAAQVYRGLPNAEIDQIEKIALNRENFFAERKR